MIFFITKKKRYLFWLSCFAVITLITYTYIYLKVLHSEPYHISQQFLINNSEVIKNIGEPIKLTINIFGGHDLRYYASSEAEAKFKIRIHGIKDKGSAVIKLKKKEDIWQITTAELILDSGKRIELK